MNAPNPRLIAALEGRYRIDRELGQGGMATVFLAQDVRHDRMVALKVLRPELAAVIGAERFLAEIKTTASLQHPHILPLHDSGEADGTVFYVMPYVEGESLRDRLNHEKQLPVADAIRIAREIASALDYAHRHNIVHRDIKPENILLHDGQALVADFGISLAVSRSDSNTRMTETGMSLGTPSYMAPEQAMGEREITQKADIYALGAVLYEMLTGDPPFTGSTAQAIVARMVTESPRAIVMQRRTVPAHVEAAVMMALEKLPADRFATAGEFAAALDNQAFVRAGDVAPGRTGAGAPRAVGWKSKAAIPLAVVAVAALAALGWMVSRSAPSRPVAQYALAFATAQAPIADRPMAVSPDGSLLAYMGPGDGATVQIWLKARDRTSAAPLVGTAGALAFTFSPDNQWIAFVTANLQLRKIPVVGGAAIPLTEGVGPARGLAWLDDGTIVYAAAGGASLARIPDAGGAVTTVWRADSGMTAVAWYPSPIPGSQGVVFTRCVGGAACETELDLWVVDFRSGQSHRVATGTIRGFYVPTGHLVYVRLDGGLLAVPFSAKSLDTSGAPVPVRDSIGVGANGLPAIAVALDGTLFTRAGGLSSSAETYEMVWVDRTGREAAVDSTFAFRPVAFGANVGWALSPDGNRLVIGLNTEAGDNLWVKQLPRGPLSRVTFDGNPAFRPRWSRDGRSVTFISYRNGNGVLYRRLADGTGQDEQVLKLNAPGIFEGAWAPDEKSLVFRAGGTLGVVGNRDIMVVQPAGDSVPKPLVASPQFDEKAIALSPDGRWLAYESNETGREEIYVRPFPNADGGKWQLSTDGGRAPLWARSGRELFYVNAAREIVVAPVATGPAPQIGVRRVLFKMREELYLANQENYTPFDISSDGQRFMMARKVRAAEAKFTPLIVTENWFEELRQRVAKR